MSGVYPLHRLWISDVSDYGRDAGVGRKEDVQGCLGAPDQPAAPTAQLCILLATKNLNLHCQEVIAFVLGQRFLNSNVQTSRMGSY